MLNVSINNNLFLSNQLEVLADHLREHLFGTGSLPFQKKLILVPGEQLKSYLLQRFVRDPQLGIAAGFQICGIFQGIDHLLISRRSRNRERIPSVLELSLQIEFEILEIIERYGEYDPETKAVMLPLLEYVIEKEDKGVVSSKTRKRLVSLSSRLAKVFSCYGLYGDGLLDLWLDQNGWQQRIWRSLYHSADLNWTYPIKILKNEFSLNTKIHLFGFAYVPKICIEFFKRLDSVFYLHSPCQAFWEDLCTEKERISIQRTLKKQGIRESQRRELDSYLKDQNAFLANLGKLGRKFLELLDDNDMISDEQYVEIEAETLLQHVQKDLLILRGPQDENQLSYTVSSEKSIQFHGCPSKLREVEVLKDNLFEAIRIESTKHHPILPKDIIVLAPDIKEYAPYIHMVFGFDEHRLNYSIYDLELSSQSQFAQALQHLIDLPRHRFEVDSFLKLFSYPNFLSKFEISEEEFSLIREWIHQATVYWGIDSLQRNAFLSQEFDGDEMLEDKHVGTWQHALDLLLKKLVIVDLEDAEGNFSSIIDIGWNEAEILGKFIHIVQSLSEDLKLLINETLLPLTAWMDYFKYLAENYFCLCDEDLRLIEEFGHFSQIFQHLKKNTFSFLSAKKILDHLLNKKSGNFNSTLLNSVKFCSLEPGAAFPSKIICLLGMQEGTFPRMDPKDSLCELSFVNKNNYVPTKMEEDRYLFLELLLCARNYFILSFQNICAKDNQTQNPSLVVKELLSYLEKNYSFEDILLSGIKMHPALAFDKSYFFKNSSFHSHSRINFLAAKTYYSSEKKKPAVFIPEFYEKITLCKKEKKDEIIIDIKQLKKLSKNPIKFYFNQTLGIYLDENTDEINKNDEFILSYLDKAILRNRSLKYPIEQILEKAHLKGQLPLGAFKEVAFKRIKEDVEELHSNLELLNITPSEIFSVELKTSCLEPILSPAGKWILPALKIPLDGGRIAYIIGSMEGLSSNGMIAHKKQTLEDLCEIWPLLLVMLNLPFLEKKISAHLLLTKCGKKKICQIPNVLSLLKNFIQYYELCEDFVSPFLPTWAKALTEENAADLEKEINKSLDFSLFKDPYLDWLYSRDPRPIAKVLIENWSSILQETFSELIQFVEEKQ